SVAKRTALTAVKRRNRCPSISSHSFSSSRQFALRASSSSTVFTRNNASPHHHLTDDVDCSIRCFRGGHDCKRFSARNRALASLIQCRLGSVCNKGSIINRAQQLVGIRRRRQL